MPKIETAQSLFDISGSVARKRYKQDWNHKYSSLEHEIRLTNKFAEISKYGIGAIPEEGGYAMPRLDIDMGDAHHMYEPHIRRIFFTLSSNELQRQLDEIVTDLERSKIHFRDIMPGNLVLSERERMMKLIDFYWAVDEDTPDRLVNCPFNNQFYTNNDRIAMEIVKKEVRAWAWIIRAQVYMLKKKFINEEGRIYNESSTTAPGVAYHPVDIPGWDVPYFHNNCVEQYRLIRDHMPEDTKSWLDIGCSLGYFTFNAMRDFWLKKATVYETDPAVVPYLKGVKKIYNLEELDIRSEWLNDETEFEQVDVVIWMNSHHWINGQIGTERTLALVKKVIANSKLLFFQTCGEEGTANKKAPYKDAKAIQKMLEECGGKVDKLASTDKHGGLRHLFRVVGGLNE